MLGPAPLQAAPRLVPRPRIPLRLTERAPALVPCRSAPLAGFLTGGLPTPCPAGFPQIAAPCPRSPGNPPDPGPGIPQPMSGPPVRPWCGTAAPSSPGRPAPTGRSRVTTCRKRCSTGSAARHSRFRSRPAACGLLPTSASIADAQKARRQAIGRWRARAAALPAHDPSEPEPRYDTPVGVGVLLHPRFGGPPAPFVPWIGRASGCARMASKARRVRRGDYSGDEAPLLVVGGWLWGSPIPPPPAPSAMLRYPCGGGGPNVSRAPGPSVYWGRPRCRWPLGWSPRPRVPLAPHGTGPRPGPLGLGLLVSPRPRCAGPSPAAAALASARRSPLRAWGLRSLSPPLRLPPLPAPTPVCPARGLPLRWSAYPLPGRISTTCRPPSAVPQGPRRILAPASRRPMSRAPRQPLPAGGVPPLRRQSPSTAWG